MEVVENRENYVVIKKLISPLTQTNLSDDSSIIRESIHVFTCFSFLTPIAYWIEKTERVICSNNVTTRDSIRHLAAFRGARLFETTAQKNITAFVDSL